MPSIFVSYRRTDAPAHAGRLYDRLVERFGDAGVFKDLDTMEPGADFAEVIEDAVAQCDALVAVIGRDWHGTDQAGRRRLDDPQDWVRLEIGNALQRKIRVVPVLVAGAKMPSPEDLPEDLQGLARRHAVELSETAWTAQVGQLMDGLERAIAKASPDERAEPLDGARRLRSRSTPTFERARELARLRHGAGVNGVAFGPDDTRLATAGDDHTARVWDAGTGEQLSCITQKWNVDAVAFSSDGTRIATAAIDGVRVWDSASGREFARLAAGTPARAVAFSPDGTCIAAATNDNAACIWDSASGGELARLTHGGDESPGGFGERLRGVAFSPDGTRIATAGEDKTARIWDAASGRELICLTHDETVGAVAFSPDGTCIVTGGYDNTARIWDAATGRELARLSHPHRSVNTVAFSPDGTRIATGSYDNLARIWDSASGRELARLTHEHGVRGVAFSPDGTRIATASGTTHEVKRSSFAKLMTGPKFGSHGYAAVWSSE
jgi:DNA-binding beta-propeller fold protein YncE